ncbi:glycoside hydrolase family 4 [Haloarcula laminariae]|uniref:family 4 glycosyl hydrolase n=1 Tax=Haloarcula laminariae TaxID=2961577 RepID=UPI0021C6E0BE|nr:glycoside hydrolase family 4 [Halomicroarcula laminariae]
MSDTSAQQERQLTSDAPVDPDNVKIGYIGGGSRLWARNLAKELALDETLSGEVVLYDTDYESAQRNEEFGNWVQDREDAVSDWTYRAVESREEALTDADFVILSTQYPPTESMKYDLEIPPEYGIDQAVAITSGPGGIMRAMRTIPVYRDIAASIREHCPDAWVLNYTNPVTYVTRTLYEEYPDINALGLCHEVFHAQELLADIVSDQFDVPKPSRDDIEVNVKGVNHFTWVDEARWNGHELLPVVERYLEESGAVREYSRAELEDADHSMHPGFQDNNQVTYELFKRFGVLPAAGDRHLVEFATWFLQGDMPEALNRWGVLRTPSSYRLDRWDDEADTVRQFMDGDKEFDLSETGEVITDLMEALSGLSDMRTHVNLPNEGQMRDVPEDAVVETNAVVTQNNVRPIVSGTLPRPVRTQVTQQIDNQETIIEAAFDGYDVDYAFQGFLNDPQVKTLQTETAADLFAEMCNALQPLLDDWQLADSETLAESDKFELE